MLKSSINQHKFSVFIISLNIVIIIIYNLISAEPGSSEIIHINQRYGKIEKLAKIYRTGIYKTLKVLFPNDAELTLTLGRMYEKDGKNEKACGEIEKALKIKLKTEREYIDLGDIYLGLKRYKEADEMYIKAIEINPNYDRAYRNLGKFIQNSGKHKEVEELYKRKLELDPKNIDAYSDLAVIYGHQKKYKEAEAVFKKGLKLNPNNQQLLSDLSNLYNTPGNTTHIKEAQAVNAKKIEELLNAIKKNPKDWGSYGMIGRVYLDEGKWNESVEYFEKSLEVEPGPEKNTLTVGYLALAYSHLGRQQEAEAMVRKALEKDPENMMVKAIRDGILKLKK